MEFCKKEELFVGHQNQKSSPSICPGEVTAVTYPCLLVLGSTGDRVEVSVGSMHFLGLCQYWREPGAHLLHGFALLLARFPALEHRATHR